MAWEVRKERDYEVIVCTPIHKEVSFSVVLACRTLRLPIHYYWLTCRGFPIDMARNHLVRSAITYFCKMKLEDIQKIGIAEAIDRALETGDKYILWIDSDTIPDDPETYYKLKGWKLPIVAGLYYLKAGHWNCYTWNEKEKKFDPIRDIKSVLPKGHELLKVDGVGMGLTLVHLKVYRDISEPYYLWTLDPDSDKPGYGEDLYFSLKCMKKKIPIYVDTLVRARHSLGGGIAFDTEGRLTPCL